MRKMLKKIKYYLPMVALVIMVLGVSYITALDNKKTAEMEAQNGQNQVVYLNK